MSWDRLDEASVGELQAHLLSKIGFTNTEGFEETASPFRRNHIEQVYAVICNEQPTRLQTKDDLRNAIREAVYETPPNKDQRFSRDELRSLIEHIQELEVDGELEQPDQQDTSASRQQDDNSESRTKSDGGITIEAQTMEEIMTQIASRDRSMRNPSSNRFSAYDYRAAIAIALGQNTDYTRLSALDKPLLRGVYYVVTQNDPEDMTMKKLRMEIAESIPNGKHPQFYAKGGRSFHRVELRSIVSAFRNTPQRDIRKAEHYVY